MRELFKCVNPMGSNKKLVQTYRYTIVKLGDNLFDISVFTSEEWEHLETINECFIQRQHWEANESDAIYSLESNREENIQYRKKIRWFDNELKKIFGIKFNDIDYDCGDEDGIALEIKILSKINVVETNKLRMWFVNNYQQLYEYYGELKG